jgi:hypothetical protein
MKDNIIKNLQQKIDDSMESIEAIQGVGFRNLLAHVMACSQAMRMMSAIQQQYSDDANLEIAARSMASVLAKGSSMLADAYDLDEGKCEELMKWVETFDNHIIDAVKEANK